MSGSEISIRSTRVLDSEGKIVGDVSNRVFEAADGVLNLPSTLSALPSDSSLALPTALPTACLTVPLTCFADPTKWKEGFIGSKPHAQMLEAVEYVAGDSLVEFLEEVVGGDLVLDDQQMHKWLREKLSEVSMR